MRKTEHWDRRRFTRRVGASLLLAPILPSWLSGCGDEASDPPPAADGRGPEAVALPGGGIALLHEDAGPPAAYVSPSRGIAWVDGAWRDRAHFLLGAYTSVSTGVWRIPLPGDDPRAPIAPGDAAREFEAVPLEGAALPPVPSAGDMRVWPGGPVRRRVEVACVPVRETAGDGHAVRPVAGAPAAERWLTAGPVIVHRFDGRRAARDAGSSRPAGREVFGVVGSGTTHAASGCSGDGVDVALFAWRAQPLDGAGDGVG